MFDICWILWFTWWIVRLLLWLMGYCVVSFRFGWFGCYVGVLWVYIWYLALFSVWLVAAFLVLVFRLGLADVMVVWFAWIVIWVVIRWHLSVVVDLMFCWLCLIVFLIWFLLLLRFRLLFVDLDYDWELVFGRWGNSVLMWVDWPVCRFAALVRVGCLTWCLVCGWLCWNWYFGVFNV